MKDAEARAMIGELRAEREAFKAELISLVENALRPVATQASKAEQLAATVGAQIQHVEDQLQVLAIEGNETRDAVNALRESLLQQMQTVGTLVKNLQAAVGPFTIADAPVDPARPGMPSAASPGLNRAQRRQITRGGGPRT